MSPEEIALPIVIRKSKKARQLTLDYAMGASILGLVPINGLLTLKLILVIGLMLKMIWNLGVIWGFSLAQDGLAIAGYVAGWVGAISMALLAWFTFFAVGIYVPFIRSFAIAAAFFTFIWMIGQATNQFFQLGRIKEYFREIKYNG